MLDAELTQVLWSIFSDAAAEVSDVQISIWREEEICLVHWNTDWHCLQLAAEILTVMVLFLALNVSTLRTDLCFCMQCSLIIIGYRVPIFQGHLATELTDLLRNFRKLFRDGWALGVYVKVISWSSSPHCYDPSPRPNNNSQCCANRWLYFSLELIRPSLGG